VGEWKGPGHGLHQFTETQQKSGHAS
jgi:hypothetical protein